MAIFKKPVPLEHLFVLLEKICSSSHDEYYLFDRNVYNLMIYRNLHTPFLKLILPYYLLSRQYFVTRDLDYNSFVTIIRQICNIHKHPFKTDKQYDHSEYTIRYFVAKLQTEV